MKELFLFHRVFSFRVTAMQLNSKNSYLQKIVKVIIIQKLINLRGHVKMYELQLNKKIYENLEIMWKTCQR